jgi:hypothetical protein
MLRQLQQKESSDPIGFHFTAAQPSATSSSSSSSVQDASQATAVREENTLSGRLGVEDDYQAKSMMAKEAVRWATVLSNRKRPIEKNAMFEDGRLSYTLDLDVDEVSGWSKCSLHPDKVTTNKRSNAEMERLKVGYDSNYYFSSILH